MAARPISELDDVAACTQKIAEVRKDRAKAVRDQSWTAVGTLHRLEADLLKRLGELRAPPADAEGEDLTPDELVEVLLAAVPGLSDPVLDRLAEAIGRRRGGGHLRVV